MLGYTFGIPLSIFAFLLVGAAIGTSSPDAAAGFMPGLIAGCAVFGLCMFLQNKSNKELEEPVAIIAPCSPERAFSKVYNCLVATHYGPSYWSLQPNPHSLRILGTLRFDENVAGLAGAIDTLDRQIRLTVSVTTNAAGQTVVNLFYNVYSPQGRWTCNEGIASTTNWIKRELMSA